MLNTVILNGVMPNFEGNYKEGDGNSKSFLSWAVSVKREYKKEDEQYYPDDLINFKAFGPRADFIKKYFNQGDGIILKGRLQRDDDYTTEDGETKKGQLFVLVESVNFVGGANKDSNDTTKNSKPATGGPGSAPKKPGKPSAIRGAAPKRPW